MDFHELELTGDLLSIALTCVGELVDRIVVRVNISLKSIIAPDVATSLDLIKSEKGDVNISPCSLVIDTISFDEVNSATQRCEGQRIRKFRSRKHRFRAAQRDVAVSFSDNACSVQVASVSSEQNITGLEDFFGSSLRKRNSEIDVGKLGGEIVSCVEVVIVLKEFDGEGGCSRRRLEERNGENRIFVLRCLVGNIVSSCERVEIWDLVVVFENLRNLSRRKLGDERMRKMIGE
ncbi:hypothetical protein Tco_0772121 [Tanacetum coccineum]|uniref:Uncharacterized protein n=1 Tax=Tanacetum coccineum TaxID=301880 RepID=A0ABQ4ZKE6_9ASTR